MKRGIAVMLGVLAAAPLGGCAKPPPSGQVLAEVDGIDITRRDLAFEAQAGAADGTSAPALLGTIVDRILLANAARAEGLDRTPDYLAALRRQREQLLADLYVKRIGRMVPAPTPAEIAEYIVRHPRAFAQRMLIQFRRIDVNRTPANESVLRDAPDFDAAIRQLKSAGARVNVTSGTLDTGRVATEVAAAIEQARGGRLTVVPAGPTLTAYAAGDRQAAPFAGREADAAAARSIILERLAGVVADRLREARQKADIRIQPGLLPSPPKQGVPR